SVLPHVLVPSLRDAIVSTKARTLLNLNLEVHTGETKGFRAQDHIDSLVKHAPELRFDVVLADLRGRPGGPAEGRRPGRRPTGRLDRLGDGQPRSARPVAAGRGLPRRHLLRPPHRVRFGS